MRQFAINLSGGGSGGVGLVDGGNSGPISAGSTDQEFDLLGSGLVGLSIVGLNNGSTIVPNTLGFTRLVDATTTGSNATLNSVAQSYVILTNASLVSISQIPNVLNGAILFLTNATGNPISLNDEDGGTAARRIRTGNGAAWILNNNASTSLIYDANASRWRLVAAKTTTPTIQTFTSGTGTYTTPAGVLYIEVEMIGGGGGGGGNTANGSGGSNGGDSTFGTSLLTATHGGGAASPGTATGGSAGSGTINSPAIQLILANGAIGQGGCNTGTGGAQLCGANGASSTLGGGGGGGNNASAGSNGSLGAGGGGGGTSASTAVPGSGGGSAGYLKAIVSSPSATYSYAVGAGGNGAATGGGSTFGGGNGGSGYIVVKEYYQ